MLEVNIDGASRGNPGLSAIGIIVKENETILMEHAEFLGIRTNNQAEYEALKTSIRNMYQIRQGNNHIIRQRIA